MRFTQDVVVPGRTPEEVFPYVSDFNRAAEWRSEVVGSTNFSWPAGGGC